MRISELRCSDLGGVAAVSVCAQPQTLLNIPHTVGRRRRKRRVEEEEEEKRRRGGGGGGGRGGGGGGGGRHHQ